MACTGGPVEEGNFTMPNCVDLVRRQSTPAYFTPACLQAGKLGQQVEEAAGGGVVGHTGRRQTRS